MGSLPERYVPFGGLWLLSVMSHQLHSDLPLSMAGDRPAGLGLGAQVRVGALGKCGTERAHTVGTLRQASVLILKRDLWFLKLFIVSPGRKVAKVNLP